MRANAGRNFIEGNDHQLLMLVALVRPRDPSAIFRVDIRLGIPFKRRAELFITPRPVCSLSLSFAALQPRWGGFDEFSETVCGQPQL